MPSKKLKAFLDNHNVKYVSISHSLAFTGLEIAKSAHVPTKILAKTVILKIDGEPAMMVLPAAYQIDMENLSKALQGAAIELATGILQLVSRLRGRRHAAVREYIRHESLCGRTTHRE